MHVIALARSAHGAAIAGVGAGPDPPAVLVPVRAGDGPLRFARSAGDAPIRDARLPSESRAVDGRSDSEERAVDAGPGGRT